MWNLYIRQCKIHFINIAKIAYKTNYCIVYIHIEYIKYYTISKNIFPVIIYCIFLAPFISGYTRIISPLFFIQYLIHLSNRFFCSNTISSTKSASSPRYTWSSIHTIIHWLISYPRLLSSATCSRTSCAAVTLTSYFFLRSIYFLNWEHKKHSPS